MKQNRYAMLVAVALGMAACADVTPGEEPTASEETEKVGSLSLNLVGSDTDGRQYRLRNGVFGISGYPEFSFPGFPYVDGGLSGYQQVSTETDPDAPVISLRVVPGSYYVNLESADWYLERLQTGGTWERVEQVVLLTSAYQYAYVYDRGVTSVAFRFGVDGELIDFRSGELQVGIEIEQPGEGPYPDGGVGYDAGFPDGGMFGGPGGGFDGSTGGPLGGSFSGGADAGMEAPDAGMSPRTRAALLR